MLEPVLKKIYFYDNHKKYIKIGEDEIEFSEKFKLYMASKHSNPNFDPQIFVLMSIVNFTVTEEGLFEKLLSDVIEQECPEDDKILKEIIVSIAEDK
jgi:dynein heavy chain